MSAPRRVARFTLTTFEPEQRAWWTEAFGDVTVPIRDPLPHYALLPGFPTPQLVFLLDFPALAPEIQQRAIHVVAKRWKYDEDELWEDVARSGFPLLATPFSTVDERWQIADDAPRGGA